MRLRFPILMTAAAMVLLSGAATAFADSSTSSNWAGYAVHRSGVRFREVSATWRQPGASCKRGHQAYSAVWVGLGGYSASSNALEQIGTEVDCSLSGKAVSSAWYELVPAPSEQIDLAVHPGDVMAASVLVVGHHVSLRLQNVTRHRVFAKTFTASSIDVSSAEWIVEAPSDCVSATACQTLPLANFGTASFAFAAAKTTSNTVGTISSRAWDVTSITLAPGGRRYVAYSGSGPFAGAAKPSPLSAAGTVFSVSYAKVAAEGGPAFARRATAVAGRLVHPTR